MRSLPGWLALLGLSCAGAQKLTDVPAPKDFYRRGAASATLIGNYVYIDGGEISQVVDGKPPKQQSYMSNSVNSTISIDMSKSWTNSDAVLRIIDRPWYSKANQAIWTDQEAGIFYVWGGKWIRGVNMTKNHLWKFTPDGTGGGTWDMEPPANPDLFNNLHQSEHGASTNTKDMAFWIGGIASGWTEYGRSHSSVLPGMVAFNMKTKTWHNGTTNFSPFDTLTAASAHYVPSFGPNGLVMVLGGIANSIVGNPIWATAPPFDFRNLTFFDPQTNKQYWQAATGDAPPFPRVSACVTGFQSPDGGYEILVTGGRNERDRITYDDAYILSLPGFVWIKAPSSPSGKRRLATCVAVGKRQMLSIGGTNSDWTDQDPAPQGLQLFDMTEMKWKDSYDADAPAYERAADVKSWYASGSLDTVVWSSEEVRQMFSVKSTDPPPSSTTTPPPSNSKTTPVGAIAGGVVGGIAGIALLAAGAWFFLRRQKQRDSARVPGSDPDDLGPTPGYYGSAPEGPKPAGLQSETGQELTGSKGIPLELNSNRDHAELGGTTPYFYHAPPESAFDRYTGPVEMDATPRR